MSFAQPLADPTISLDEVVLTDALDRRAAGPPRYEAEARALAGLAEAMTSKPDDILLTLAETAMQAVGADSAGVSILEAASDAELAFHWRAVAGAFAPLAGITLPRAGSPCGVVIDRDESVLFQHPERHFVALRLLDPPVVEALLLPFHLDGVPAGTLWVAMHTPARKLHREDARILGSLAHFAAIAYQLQTSLDEARHASAAKSRFLATMSHELRTPLTGVIGYADLLETEVVGPVNGQQRDLLKGIQSNSWHLVGIIDEILTASRVDSDRGEVALADCDLRELVGSVVQTLQTGLVGRDLRVVIERGPSVVAARTDPGKVRRILTNLIENAIKYTEQGEVRIVLEARADGRACVQVRDTGPGIPTEQRELIFEPFVRGSSSGETSGSGLGLAICRKLASLLGGSINLESAPGRGCTFTLELPAGEAGTPPPA